MKAVMFVGPSLPGTGGLAPSVDARPPAAAGDLYRAVRSGADLIALIDARFEDRLTVLHQEILFALSEGVHVWGAASMGALRAVECGPFGMRGFGRIFEMYRDGVLEDDHEVAVLYGPAELGFPPLTVPLVSVRATMADAVAAGVLDERDAQVITEIARDTNYKDLTWKAVLARLPAGMAQGPLAEWLKTGAVDLKARDAEQLVEAVNAAVAGTLPAFSPRFEFQETLFWTELVEAFQRDLDDLSPQDSAVLDELRLDPLRYTEAVQRAFARRLAAADLPIDDAVDDGAIDAFRADLGLMTAKSFDDWLQANRTDRQRLSAFLANDLHLEGVLDTAAPSLSRDMLDDLRSEGLFADLDRRASAKAEMLKDRDPSQMPDQFLDFDLRDLFDWFCQQKGLSEAFENIDDAARSLGLRDRKSMHVLLRREFEYTTLADRGSETAEAADDVFR